MKSYRVRIKENLLSGEIWLDVVENSEPHSFPNDDLQLKSTIILVTRKYLPNHISLWRAVHRMDGSEAWSAFPQLSITKTRVKFRKHSEQWVWWEKEGIFSRHMLYKKEGS